jgi:hypothetical protein
MSVSTPGIDGHGLSAFAHPTPNALQMLSAQAKQKESWKDQQNTREEIADEQRQADGSKLQGHRYSHKLADRTFPGRAVRGQESRLAIVHAEGTAHADFQEILNANEEKYDRQYVGEVGHVFLLGSLIGDLLFFQAMARRTLDALMMAQASTPGTSSRC